MRKLLIVLVTGGLAASFVIPANAAASSVTVGASDVRVTSNTYVRHDGGTDPTIEACNDDATPGVFGKFAQHNEPFSVVDPTDPRVVVAGWNDYCSDWMGLAYSTDGGATWTNSLVPGYPADTSTEGVASPEYLRTNNASDPVGAFDTRGHFYFGFLAFNGFAGPKTNSDLAVARYNVVASSTNDGSPLDYIGTTRIERGPAAANFEGRFNDKEQIEVDRTGGANDGYVYACFTKFPASGQSTVYFSRSTDGGVTFSKAIAISGRNSGQGCDIAIQSDGHVFVSWRDFEQQSSKRNFGVSAVVSTNGGQTFSKQPTKVADLIDYTPFDGTRDCGDGADLCPSQFVFGRVPLEPRLTADPTGQLPGVFAIFNASDPSTVVTSTTTYSSAGPGSVGQSKVFVSRSLDDGKTWSSPTPVSGVSTGHQIFPDGDALAGRLAIVWQDSRIDPCYSVQRPIGNTSAATSCGGDVLRTYAAVSTDGTNFTSPVQASSSGQQPQYEMFDARSVPFLGDYNWIQLVDVGGGSLFGYMTWTDNRDVATGVDPREATQDGFDVYMCVVQNPDGSFGTDTCPNAGGRWQNIYGNTISIT
jgi:hypothetical protein